MDLNELLKQHQIALMNSDHRGEIGKAQENCPVRYYARRIAILRSELGVREYQNYI